MKIVQICFVYPPSFSGYGKQLQTLNHFLHTSMGSEIDVIILTAFDKAYHKSRKKDGVRVQSLFKKDRKSYHNRLAFYWFCITLIPKLLWYLPSTDVVHCIKGGPEAAISILIAKIFGVPSIVKIAQDEMKPDNITNWFRCKRYQIILSAKIIIALSYDTANYLKSFNFSKSRIFQINNSVDVDRFKPVNNNDARLKLESTFSLFLNPGPIFIYSGSISVRKGVEYILEAINNWKGAPLNIILAGPNYLEIADFEERLSILRNSTNISIKYIGNIDTPEFLYQAADVTLLMSSSEGMPNTVLESLSCGTPVIVSNIPVHLEIIHDKIGRILKLGDIAQLKSTIEDVAINKYQWNSMRNDCRRFILNNFSTEIVGLKYKKLYKEIL